MKIKRFQNIVEHSASGLRMPEALARRIEELSRGLPRDFTYRRIARKTDSISLDVGERTDVSVINTDAVDREGECVLPAGGDWSAYNRVVTFAHCYDQLPVGSNWWIRPVRQAQGGPVRQAQGGPNGAALVAKTHYPPKPADWGEAPWLPSAILHLMQQPVPTCTGKSIGFLPTNVRQASSDEISRRPELRGVPVIDRWVGVEYAVVPVPCNPEAEMQTVAKGMELGMLDAALCDLIAAAGIPDFDSPRTIGSLRRAIPGREEIRRLVLEQMRDVLGAMRGRIC